jgi:hypothetical protein
MSRAAEREREDENDGWVGSGGSEAISEATNEAARARAINEAARARAINEAGVPPPYESDREQAGRAEEEGSDEPGGQQESQGPEVHQRLPSPSSSEQGPRSPQSPTYSDASRGQDQAVIAQQQAENDQLRWECSEFERQTTSEELRRRDNEARADRAEVALALMTAEWRADTARWEAHDMAQATRITVFGTTDRRAGETW